MGVEKTINQVLSKVNLKLSKVPSSIIEEKLFHISKEDYEINQTSINLKKLNISVSYDSDHPLIIGYNEAKRIVEQLKGKFFYSEDNSLLLKINDTQFFINDAEELGIINEVFIEGAYNVLTPKNDTVLIDIGMNVGITSLFFASKPSVYKCYSFELFPTTYKAAKRNININKFGSKIQAFEYGLGKNDNVMNLPYSFKTKGRMGINGLPKDDTFDNTITQEVVVKDVCNIFRQIASENPGKFIICKMDCEGAEYDLVERLYSDGLLEISNVYMIEWHYKRPQELIKQLNESGFIVLYSTFKSDDSGMIYAFKNL